MHTLSDLVQISHGISVMIIEAGGEFTPELEALISSVDTELETKVDSYVHVLARLEIETDFYKQKAEALTRIARAHASLRERLKDRIKDAMRAMGKPELLGSDSRFKLSKMAPKLSIVEESLPVEYKTEVVSLVPDKDRIKKDLMSGSEIPGARLEEVVALRQYVNSKGTG